MAGVLSSDVIEASNQARDDFLKLVDPAAFRPRAPAAAAPPPPPANAGNGAPPPPTPAAAPAPKRLRPDYYGASFFALLPNVLGADKVLVADMSGDNWDFSGWFNYFFKEAGTAAPEARGRILSLLFDLNQVIEVSGRALVAKSGFTLPARTSIAFNRMLALEPQKVPLGLLAYLLGEGFESYGSVAANAALVSTAADTGGTTPHVFGPMFAHYSASQNVAPIDRDLKDGHLFFYRGDSREPSTVVQHGGARCRADLAHWRKAANVDAPWHPWRSSTQLSDKMWVRKGNADNDYFTVNSIAMDFHIACAYPILRMGELRAAASGGAHPFRGHIHEWTDQERAWLRATGKANYCTMVRRATGQREYVLFDSTRIYVCQFKEDTQLSPTHLAGNTYPEMGVRGVELDQIVAYLEIDRFHNNDGLRAGAGGQRSPAGYESTAAGSTMTILVKDWHWFANGNVTARNALWLKNPVTLESKFNQLKGKAFEINHSRLVSRNAVTYDVGTRQAAANKWGTVQGSSTVKI